jgi:hypothetical protein
MVSATFLYAGMCDYWGGDGDRWDDNKGCLFAYYGRDTTLRGLIDQWVDDFCRGGDCDSLPEDVTENDIKSALLDMLTEEGRRDYDNDAICEFSRDWEGDDDYDESPVAIVLIEYCDLVTS